ncbi:hypothetical protein [Xanthomonas graminis]|uniref:Putative membrane protein n=1 Tax=Xanthomonas graminis pv. arrhenatheri LMG 727 TaxID=1195923 RepID=A0A0K2ZMT2_9XANT|nr:hypothetical protein [Xanthomonas translucens]UKE78913.1 hypothetical protein KM317_06730 [Xanthomonas translucens pv. arrhenatheri]CTP84715.1 putative membrane protein [Xanthomonas translucens pv. arrhenatheri LMG 727]
MSAKLAELHTQLLAASQDAAQQRRRIETQRLSLQFAAPAGERSRSEIGEAFAGTGLIFAATAWAIRALAALAPFVVLGGAIWWLLAWLRRRRRRV